MIFIKLVESQNVTHVVHFSSERPRPFLIERGSHLVAFLALAYPLGSILITSHFRTSIRFHFLAVWHRLAGLGLSRHTKEFEDMLL